MKWMVLGVGLLLGCVACVEEAVDIGDETPAGTGGAGAAEGLVRAWEGYSEVPLFPSGSDRVRLEQYADGTGMVRFGDGPPPPPATNFDVGYPEGWDWLDPSTHFFPIDGYEYTLTSMSLDDLRLQFGIRKYEFWSTWCEHQTPIFRNPEDGGYYCIPLTGFVAVEGVCYLGATVNDTPVDCGKMRLCDLGAVCSCDVDGCFSSPWTVPQSLPRVGARLDWVMERTVVHLVEQ